MGGQDEAYGSLGYRRAEVDPALKKGGSRVHGMCYPVPSEPPSGSTSEEQGLLDWH